MYSISRVRDKKNCPQIQALISDLPEKPYCTDEKGVTYIRSKPYAIVKAYVQPNTPYKTRWLVFDLDHTDAIHSWYDADVPPPQIIIVNPKNGHAHYCYKLTYPVAKQGVFNPDTVRYLDNVQKALCLALSADANFHGNLIKNPAHAQWDTYITGSAPSYTLGELAEYLDLSALTTDPKTTATVANDDSYGRNCNLFDYVRVAAYPIANGFSFDGLFRVLMGIAQAYNDGFTHPLPYNEVKHTVTSIAKFCTSDRFGGGFSRDYSEEQRQRAIIANTKSQACNKGGKARSDQYNDKRVMAQEMELKGYPKAKIARELGVDRRTVGRWLKC